MDRSRPKEESLARLVIIHFLGLFRFSIEINIFLPFNAKLGRLENDSNMYQQFFLASYWSAAPALVIGWRILQVVRQRQEKSTSTTPPSLSEALAASQRFLLLVNDTQHVIS